MKTITLSNNWTWRHFLTATALTSHLIAGPTLAEVQSLVSEPIPLWAGEAFSEKVDMFNYGEAVLWLGISFLFLFRVFRKNAVHRDLHLILVIGFFAFGISDLVEVQSGAWWRPWWLLLWKTACVAVLAPSLYRLVKLN